MGRIRRNDYLNSINLKIIMQKRWSTTINVLLILILAGFLIYVVWGVSFRDVGLSEEKDCIDVNNVASFIYNSCYDAYTKNILLEVKRGEDLYNLRMLEISFFDFSEKNYKIEDVPANGELRAYKILAEKNPINIGISLGIFKEFSAEICEEPRKVFLEYCPVGISKEGVEATITPFKETNLDNFIEVGSSRKSSDILSLSLVEKERIWKSQCESSWQCGSWGSCEEGIQRRNCNDANSCFIPTGKPETSKYCGELFCDESWECEWSRCSGGFTVPTCMDKNKCGTEFDTPQKLGCTGSSDLDKCVPDIFCDAWSDCNLDYNFLSLVGNLTSELRGMRSRICRDLNSCVGPINEVRECFLSIDIYTKKIYKCAIEYVGVYNKLDDSLIARIEQGSEDNPFLNIRIDDGNENLYCDYCYDGVRDGDEERVDCGGGCVSCEEKYKKIIFREKTWLDNFVSWFKKLIT